jgi:endo-1,4-beta-xylanase
MTDKMTLYTPMSGRLVRALSTGVALALVSACGGSGETSGPILPTEKTCQQDPTQAKCIVTPPATTLRSLSAAKGRSFGVAVDAAFFGASPAQYDTLVAREFNMIVAGNVMKWSSIHRDSRYIYRWTNPDGMVSFAQANTMKVRGHTLAWHQQNPTWLTGTTWNPETLKVVLKEHIDSVVGHYKGKVAAWDVVNEAINDGNGTLRTTGSPWVHRTSISPSARRAQSIRPRCCSTTTTISSSPARNRTRRS